MTIFMIVAAVLLVLGFFLRGGEGSSAVYCAIAPTENYSDPSSYVGKKVLVEATIGDLSVLGSGVIEMGELGPRALVYEGEQYFGQLNLENSRLVFVTSALTAGQELTIKVSIAEESSGSGAGGLVVHDNNHSLDKTWQEIYEALASGRSVMIVSEEAGSYQVTVVLIARGGEGSYSVADSMEQSYYASSPDSYPTSKPD